MAETNWALLSLVGIGLVALGNVLRWRRTGRAGCLGHFFVAAREMTVVELLLNRSGIVVFALGVVLGILPG